MPDASGTQARGGADPGRHREPARGLPSRQVTEVGSCSRSTASRRRFQVRTAASACSTPSRSRSPRVVAGGHGAEWFREEHAAVDHRRHGNAHDGPRDARWFRSLLRRCRRPCGLSQSADRFRLPRPPPARGLHGARQRAPAGAGVGPGAARPRGPRHAACSSASASRAASRINPGSSRGASGSVWRWPVRWCCRPVSCSPTSRRASSIRGRRRTITALLLEWRPSRGACSWW